MTRRLILAALALFAFLALESCGVNRVAGPVSDTRSFGAQAFKNDHGRGNKPQPVVEQPIPVDNSPTTGGGDEQPIERSH